MLLGQSKVDKQRKEILDFCCNGNVFLPYIQHYTLQRHVQKEMIAARFAAALAPHAIKPFARHRWTTSAVSVRESALLFLFCDASVVIPKWLDRLTTRAERPGPAAGEGNMVEQQPDLGGGGSDWAGRNIQAKIQCRAWAETAPLPRLLMMSIVLETFVHAMAVMLHKASSDWEEEQSKNVVDGGFRSHRMLEAYIGETTRAYFEDVRALFMSGDSRSPWLVFPEAERTIAATSIAFAMLARGAGSVHFQVVSKNDNYPLKLMTLLTDPAQASQSIMTDPRCRLDPFSSIFLSRFDTIEKLTSDEARVSLIAIGLMARCDTSRIECRHASIRRMLMLHSQTHLPCFADASCDFILRRQRLLEQAGAKQEKRDAAAATAEGCGESAPKRLRGGGGPCRAFLSEELAGKPWTPENLTVALAAYRKVKAQGGDELARLVAKGSLGSTAHREGGRSFASAALRPPTPVGEAQERSDIVQAQAEGGFFVELDRRLREIRQRERAAHVQQRRDEDAMQQTLASWSQSESGSPALSAVAQTIWPSRYSTPEAVHSDVSALRLTLPCAAMTEKILHRIPKKMLGLLTGDWIKTHNMLLHRDADSISAPLVRMTLCHKARLCLCSKRGEAVAGFVKSFAAMLRHNLAKDSPLRALSDRGALVMQFRGSDGILWFHIPSINHTTWAFNLMPLRETEDLVRRRMARAVGRVALEVFLEERYFGIETAWRVVEQRPPEQAQDILCMPRLWPHVVPRSRVSVLVGAISGQIGSTLPFGAVSSRFTWLASRRALLACLSHQGWHISIDSGRGARSEHLHLLRDTGCASSILGPFAFGNCPCQGSGATSCALASLMWNVSQSSMTFVCGAARTLSSRPSHGAGVAVEATVAAKGRRQQRR